MNPEQQMPGVKRLSGYVREQPNLVEEMREFYHRNVTTARRVSRSSAIPPDLHLQARCRSLAGFTLLRSIGKTAHIDSTPSKAVRGESEIANDGRGPFKLYLPLQGENVLCQFGRTQRIEAGAPAFLSLAEPNTCESWKGHTGSDAIIFLMPREFVIQRFKHAEDFCIRPLSTSKGLEELAIGSIRLFEKSAWSLTAEQFVKSAHNVTELLLLALDGCTSESHGERSVRAANLSRVKQIIRTRLAEPDLTLADVALAAGLSLGYLHKLFRDEEQTVYEYLKTQRLQRAHELLQFPRSSSMTVTDVCFESGFSDPSYFSRSFKQVFGISPREVSCTGPFQA